jgi:ribosomal protein S18 acetylase RimI-like enzyme
VPFKDGSNVRMISRGDFAYVAEKARQWRLSVEQGPIMVSERTLSSAFDSGRLFGLTIESGGQSVGYCLYEGIYDPISHADGFYLCDIFIEPSFRRHGFGKLLIDALKRIATDRGKSFIWWVSASENAQANSFYKSIKAHENRIVSHSIILS